jgi:hypothetical protein
MTERRENETREPRSVLGALDELLKRPFDGLRRADLPGPPGAGSRRLLIGAVLCWTLYGAAAGFFQGGAQIPVAALKAGLIVAASLLLCMPSLYVFAALLGANLSPRVFLAVVSGFGGMVGLLLLGLLPIGWLFSVSSTSLAFVSWLHLLLWLLALLFAKRFLGEALRQAGSRSGAFLWVGLFCLVSLQVTTLFRPVLWRDPGGAFFEGEKMFFLEQFGRIMEGPPKAPAKNP